MPPQPAPFMNSFLHKAIYKKKMFFNKFLRCKSKFNWENFRKMRNYVNMIRKRSIQNYFLERCSGGCKEGDFWKTIKPFLTNKSTFCQKSLVIKENENLISDQLKISNIFNDLYVNVAKDIGDKNTCIDENHDSIKKINDNTNVLEKLDFKPI